MTCYNFRFQIIVTVSAFYTRFLSFHTRSGVGCHWLKITTGQLILYCGRKLLMKIQKRSRRCQFLMLLSLCFHFNTWPVGATEQDKLRVTERNISAVHYLKTLFLVGRRW